MRCVAVRGVKTPSSRRMFLPAVPTSIVTCVVWLASGHSTQEATYGKLAAWSPVICEYQLLSRQTY